MWILEMQAYWMYRHMKVWHQNRLCMYLRLLQLFHNLKFLLPTKYLCIELAMKFIYQKACPGSADIQILNSVIPLWVIILDHQRSWIPHIMGQWLWLVVFPWHKHLHSLNLPGELMIETIGRVVLKHFLFYVRRFGLSFQ